MKVMHMLQYATALRATLVEELARKEALIEAQTALETTRYIRLAWAKAEGAIDGKNADTRKAQSEAFLRTDPDYTRALRDYTIANNEAALASIEVEAARATVGIIKAWLYSQREAT